MGGMSPALAVLMAKVLVFLSVVAGFMSLITVAGLSAPRFLNKMEQNGGKQAKCRCAAWQQQQRAGACCLPPLRAAALSFGRVITARRALLTRRCVACWALQQVRHGFLQDDAVGRGAPRLLSPLSPHSAASPLRRRRR